MREQAGIFNFNDMDLKNLNFISISVSSTPVFCSLNNPNLNPRICGYFLHILNELDLVVKTIDNPLRRMHAGDAYESFCKDWSKERTTYIRGTYAKNINFIIINICKLLESSIIKEYSKKAFHLEKEQYEFDKSLEELNLEAKI
jgi:hypothetical protein